MIYWYDSLYMDEIVKKNIKKCKKNIEEGCRQESGPGRRFLKNKCLFGKGYFVLVLANNGKNLFEIMNTNQMFFRYYGGKKLYVLGVARDFEGAVEIFRYIMTKGYEADREFDPRQVFTKDRFVSAGKPQSAKGNRR